MNSNLKQAIIETVIELKAENDRLKDENSQMRARLEKAEQFVEEIKRQTLSSKKLPLKDLRFRLGMKA